MRDARPVRNVALIGTALALCACSTVPTTGTSSNAIAYASAGQGTPVVVLQSGLGDDKSKWAPVFAQLAQTRTVIALDRPGYGDSPSAAGPRDPCTIAAEQRAALSALGARPPYVLVGHSLGGLYQFAYSKLYPQEVAALVLVDATHPGHWDAVQADARLSAALVGVLRFAFTPTMRREFDDQSACIERLDLSKPLAIPVRVLSRTRFAPMESGGFADLARRLQDDWTRLTGATRVERIEGAGHYIHHDRPDAVVAAVRDAA